MMKIPISKYLSAIKVALWYLVIGILWIYFSDRIIDQIAINSDNILYFQTMKGVLFVTLSSLLIYFLVNVELKKIRTIYAELAEAKTKLNEALQIGKIGNWEFDHEKKTITGSDETARIFGIEPDLAISIREILKIIHPDDRRSYYTQIQNSVNGTQQKAIRYRIVVEDKIKYIKENINIVKNDQGQIIRLFGTVQDLTEEKLAQQHLAEKEMMYRLLAENTSNLVVLHKLDGTPEYISPNIEKILGYTFQEYASLETFSRIFPDDLPLVKQKIKAVGQGKEDIRFSFRFLKKDDSIIWLESNFKPVKNSNGEIVKFTSTALDISDSKEFELKLSEREKQFRLLFENMPVAYGLHEIITDEQGKPVDYTFLKINSKFEELTGHKSSELIGKTVLSVFPNTEAYWIENYGKVALTGEPMVFSNYSVELDKHYEVSTYCPEPGKFAVTFFDITERIKTTEQIQNYQAKLKNLIYELFITEEREKRQLAIDLHDHFSQLLAISKMKISEFARNNQGVEKEPTLVDARKYLEEALNKARSITYDLSPPVLYEFGLLEAMNWFINKIKKEHQLEINFYKKLENVKFSQESQTTIYRIFTELITNVIKHARAKSVKVIIEEVNDMFYLRVSDDGIGFETDAVHHNKKSFGLFSIKERVEQLRGSTNFVSGKNKGTEISVRIPLK